MPYLNLEEEFERRKPWVTKFVIGGREYGGDFDPTNDPRVPMFFKWFPEAREILEFGSLEGGHTFNLANNPKVKRVVALEARLSNLERAVFVQQLLGITNIEFKVANLEEIELAPFGKFDALFCSGLLYHLPEPWKLISQFSKLSMNLFIWTHYADDDQANETVNGYTGRLYKEAGISDPLSGLSNVSFWPTLGSLIKMLTMNGYRTIHIVENNLTHPHGPSVMMAVTAS